MTKGNENTVDMDDAMLGDESELDAESPEQAVEVDEYDDAAKTKARIEKYETDDDDRIIYPLLESVTVEGGAGTHTWNDIRIRRPKGRDIRASGAGKNSTDQGLILLARCTRGGTARLVDELGPEDIEEASNILAFLSQKKRQRSNSSQT